MIKNIIFDFDGVILDSVPTKTEAYRKLFEGFAEDKIEDLLEYHIKNGGISRYAKIKYFYEELLNESISEIDILNYADKYSQLTKIELTNPKYLIEDALSFVKQNYEKYNMHVASGADEMDLKYICSSLDLTKYFLSINGSPIKKIDIVSKVLADNDYTKSETILIGDSINDYEAANQNNIKFYGYNNKELKSIKKSQYVNIMRTFDPNK